MPIIQIDWQKIIGKLGDVTALYALTHRQASLLLSLAEQLTYDKTFRVGDHEENDTDEIDWEVADIGRNLTMPVDVEDFVIALNAIKNAIDAQAALMDDDLCCDEIDYSGGELLTDYVDEGVGDVPANVISAGYATDVDDWDGFDDYKCVISHVMVWNLAAKVEKIAGMFDTAGALAVGFGAIAGLIAVIFGGPAFWAIAAISITAGAAALVYETLADEGEAITDGLSNDILSNIEDLACGFYLGDGAAGSHAGLNAAIDDIYDAPVSTLLKNMNMLPMAKALYAGRHDQINLAQKLDDFGLDAESVDCGDCGLEDYEERWDWTSDIEDPWRLVGDAFWSGGNISMAGNAELHCWVGELREYLGLAVAGTLLIERLKFSYVRYSAVGSPRVHIVHDGGSWEWVYDDLPTGSVYTKEVFFDPPLEVTHPINPFIEFDGSSSSNVVNNLWVELDLVGS